MYELIEAYGQDGSVEIGGRKYPCPALIEDEDGHRALLVRRDQPFLQLWWGQAYAAGARAVVGVAGEGYSWLFADQFADVRVARGPVWEVPDTAWLWLPTPPSYRSMVAMMPRTTTGDFVHLHAHSEFSALDGYSRVNEMIQAAVDDNQPAIALTDHGVCAGHPEFWDAAMKAGINPILGIEAYFVNDRLRRSGKAPRKADFSSSDAYDEALAAHKQDVAEVKDYWHLILWAENERGLQNIWAAVTASNQDGLFGGRPRMDWDLLSRYTEGVFCSTGCLRGPLAQPLLDGNDEVVQHRLGMLTAMFPDRLWVEIQTNHLEQQIELNHRLIEMARRYDLPLIAASDSHYPSREDKHTHQVWMAIQTQSDLSESGMFEGDQDHHLMTADEVRESLSYLPDDVVKEAMENTVAVADRCKVQLPEPDGPPVHTSSHERDVERLFELCFEGWPRVAGKGSEEEYLARLEREMNLLVDKQFCGYFLHVADYVRWAKEQKILVGPSRGSGGGSLVAYLARINEVDPIEADLMFERFLTEGRTELPDFDMDFPTSMRDTLADYMIRRYGADHVMRVGTHTRLKNRGVIRSLARVFADTVSFPDVDKISKIIERAEGSSAGLGLSWEDLWIAAGEDLEPYLVKYPEMFELAGKMVGRLKSYGRHPAGLVVSNDSLADRFPMRMAGEVGNRQAVSEFAMDALALFGLLKDDHLTLRTLDTLQVAMDMIEGTTGTRLDPYSWKDEYLDPLMWDEIGAGNTLGIFQLETSEATKLCRQVKPRSVHDLAHVITLNRPGPERSGLKALYLRRRAGEEEVSYVDPRLEPVLGRTLGVILYQEDVMAACSVLAGYDLARADKVRRILGKKKVEKVQAEGEAFIPACVERGMAKEAATSLWEQLGEFARYSFNRSHAYGYAVLGVWCAYLKVHYPVEFTAALLSTVDKDRIPDFVAEARRIEVPVLPPDINQSGEGFSVVEGAVRYGFAAIKGIGEKGVHHLIAGQPYASWEDFWDRKGAVGADVVGLLIKVGAFDSINPNRRELEERLDRKVEGADRRCVNYDSAATGPNGLPCVFNWDSEPAPMGKRNKPLKRKDPPKRCTVACRQYVPSVAPGETPVLNVEPYTKHQQQAMEMELLGVHLSSSPFDEIPEDVWAECSGVVDIEEGPCAQYIVAGMVTKVRTHTDRSNRKMAFVGIRTPWGDLPDATCFSGTWKTYQRDLRKNSLVFAAVTKQMYQGNTSLVLDELLPINSE